MVIYLAGLQGVPQHLYEAAAIDGAGALARFRHVTVPMLSPIIFFNLVLQIIGSFQVFTAGYIMTRGGPEHATLFYVLYLFQNAFQYFKMGYASALAWVLFFIVLAFSLLVFRYVGRLVHYEEAR
jgi:multiple sugar transport system permease protein